MKRGEVEIARISLQSVTSDQISVRARRVGGRIGYTVVDEYKNEYVQYDLRPRTSSTPLSMRSLVAMLDGACEDGGAVMSHTVGLVPHVNSPDELDGFTSVESDFYPELAEYYAARLDAYLETLRTEDVEAD